MLYLAQVKKNEFAGTLELQLLARQESEDIWTLMTKEELVTVASADSLHQGLLVLVELSANQQVLSIQDAKGWVMNLVEQYLSSGLTPAFLQQEAEQAEQWRRELTLQSQELARKTLEIEARREQIQTLEEELKQEKK